MNLKNLSDQTLLAKTESLVRQERELLTQILHHLREIDSRRLFSDLGFKSIFEYAVKKLGYSDDQAGRRISAMRLLQEIPEIEDKIESGSLSLTNLSMAQTLFRQEKKIQRPLAKEEKINLLAQLENKSKREAEKIVLAVSSTPNVLTHDRVKAVNNGQVEIRFVANEELLKKIEKLKGLLAHSQPEASMAELLNKVCDIALAKLDPCLSQAKSPAPAPLRKVKIRQRRLGAPRAAST
jgi:hypothetical protein